jgi:hypothetical protein|tara:strand:- start:6391 stop:6747 length:357 start_codon:yes stop_codon:yes gene_type:complete
MTCNCPATTSVGHSDTSIPFLNMGGGGKGRKKKNRKSKTNKKKAKQTKTRRKKKHMRKSRKNRSTRKQKGGAMLPFFPADSLNGLSSVASAIGAQTGGTVTKVNESLTIPSKYNMIAK